MAPTTGTADPTCMACGWATACAYHGRDLGEIREADRPPVHERESRNVAADLGIPPDELERAPCVDACAPGRARSPARNATSPRWLRPAEALVRATGLQPSVSSAHLREATAKPEARRRSIAKDLGLAGAELVPVEQFREAITRRSALVARWRELDRLPPSDATALDFSDSLDELAAIARLVA